MRVEFDKVTKLKDIGNAVNNLLKRRKKWLHHYYMSDCIDSILTILYSQTLDYLDLLKLFWFLNCLDIFSGPNFIMNIY